MEESEETVIRKKDLEYKVNWCTWIPRPIVLLYLFHIMTHIENGNLFTLHLDEQTRLPVTDDDKSRGSGLLPWQTTIG